MRFIAFVFTALFISLSAPLASAQTAQENDKAVIDKFIAGQATREHGEEYPDARKVVTGDLNRDGTAETVVLYTIEGQNGSNNHIQYLAVFKRTNGKEGRSDAIVRGLVYVTHISVGSKSYRDVELDSISNGSINLTTLRFARNDPSCCPTLKGKARYRLVNGTLQLERRARYF